MSFPSRANARVFCVLTFLSPIIHLSVIVYPFVLVVALQSDRCPNNQFEVTFGITRFFVICRCRNWKQTKITVTLILAGRIPKRSKDSFMALGTSNGGLRSNNYTVLYKQSSIEMPNDGCFLAHRESLSFEADNLQFRKLS